MTTLTQPRFSINALPRIPLSRTIPPMPGEVCDEKQTAGLSKAEMLAVLREQCRFEPHHKQQGVLRGHERASRCLEDAKSQTEHFVRTVLDQSFDLEQCEVGTKILEQICQVMRNLLGDIYGTTFSRQPSVKTLELISRPPEQLYAALHRELSNDIEAFVDELFTLNRHLAERMLVGSIRYMGAQRENCEFSFFRSKATTELTGREEKESVSGIRYWTDKVNGQEWMEMTFTTDVLESGVAEIRHVWSTHLLSQVRTLPIDAWSLPLPPRIQAVIAAIPQFLRPHAYLVEGMFERGRIIERDVAQMPYQYRFETTRDEKTRHYDPALLIGGAVVAGWCPEEQPEAGRFRRWGAGLVHRLANEGAGQ